ncbi:MAG: glycogen/starch synthase [Coprothermobacterota bacterium]|nr:glycogen/starch synthase [Coprothermobacterota bacterium]
MRIAFIAAEASPFIKVGGLGDVIGSLPPALRQLGHQPFVLIPACSSIPGLAEMMVVGEFCVPWPGSEELVRIHKAMHSGVPYYFLENGRYLSRERVYGYPDDAERFAFFSRAALESLRIMGTDLKSVPIMEGSMGAGFPDLVHVHDWHASPVLLYLKTPPYCENPAYTRIATVLTIHNLSFQGIADPDLLPKVGLALSPDNALSEFSGRINLMTGGIKSADTVGTVSPTYAREILTPEMGCGLEVALSSRRRVLFGILNGIDTEEFAPPFQSKRLLKAQLQASLGLPVREEVPLLAVVSRLSEQKGFDLFPPILDSLLAEEVQLVVLGTGDERYERLFREATEQCPAKVSANGGFNAPLAKQIYAGADLFLMPSRFEPCGLGQMIALRYGTVPVVRRTGGLADTVFEYNEESQEGNGFLFAPYQPSAFLSAIRRAFSFYKQETHWERIVSNGLTGDYSWASSAPRYIEAYQNSLRQHRYGDRFPVFMGTELILSP